MKKEDGVLGEEEIREEVFADDEEAPERKEEICEALTIGPCDAGVRLDLYIASQLGITRSYAKKLIEEERVRPLSERGKAKAGFRIGEGERYEVSLPPPQGIEIEPEPVPFDVVYEDSHILVIDKPAGLVVHPAPGHWRGTLVHGLLWRYPDIGISNGVIRPGIVHRLDRTTSGLMVVTRNGAAQEAMIDAFRNRHVDKRYLALVKGTPSPEGEVDAPIGRDRLNRLRMAVDSGGREALTSFRRLWTAGGCSLVVCRIHTGRTHQIRVHMRHIGCPLVGDDLYAGGHHDPMPLDRVFLHAWRLAFLHPVTKESLAFSCPLPDQLREYLRAVLARAGERH